MEVNLVAVVLAALSAFFLGYIWYTLVFAKPWQKEIGMSDEAAKQRDGDMQGFAKRLGISFVLELIAAYFLATMIGTAADAMTGLRTGLMVGLFFVSAAFGINYLFEGKTMNHWLINVGYNTVLFALMGLIIGAL